MVLAEVDIQEQHPERLFHLTCRLEMHGGLQWVEQLGGRIGT